MIDVSVIFPTYNRPAYLKLALDSILAQQGVDLECLVLDHGSTSETAAVLQNYSDPRLRTWRREVNRAPGATCPWQDLALNSSGRYIVLFSDDDIMMPGNLAKKSEVLNTHPECGFAFSRVELFGDVNGLCDFDLPKQVGYLDATPFDNLIIRNQICMPSVMFRREWMPFFGVPPHGALNDWALWLEIASRSRSAFIPHPLIKYRIHGNSDSKTVGGYDCEFFIQQLRIWRYWLNKGYRPTAQTYDRMERVLRDIAGQQIALLKEAWPPLVKPMNLLNLLK